VPKIKHTEAPTLGRTANGYLQAELASRLKDMSERRRGPKANIIKYVSALKAWASSRMPRF
jgi:hypothetical protein